MADYDARPRASAGHPTTDARYATRYADDDASDVSVRDAARLRFVRDAAPGSRPTAARAPAADATNGRAAACPANSKGGQATPPPRQDLVAAATKPAGAPLAITAPKGAPTTIAAPQGAVATPQGGLAAMARIAATGQKIGGGVHAPPALADCGASEPELPDLLPRA